MAAVQLSVVRPAAFAGAYSMVSPLWKIATGFHQNDIAIKTRLHLDTKRCQGWKVGPDVDIEVICSGLNRCEKSAQYDSGTDHAENGPGHHKFLGICIATSVGLVAMAVEQVHDRRSASEAMP